MELTAMGREALVRALFAAAKDDHGPAVQIARDGGEAPGPTRSGRLHQTLAIARELLVRDLARDLQQRPLFDSPSSLRDWLTLQLGTLEHEVFTVLFLDATHRLIASDQMFRGSVSQTTVYPREVVKAALAHNASAVVLAHNHPSGEPYPSRADEHLTSALKAALAMVDVRVLDHFIVGGNKTLSMAEKGLL